MIRIGCFCLNLTLASSVLSAAEKDSLPEQMSNSNSTEVGKLLSRPILDSTIPQQEVETYVESHLLPMPQVSTVQEWEAYAQRLRQQVLERVVLRGEARQWARMPLRVEWLEEIEGGPGYQIRKLRYEAVPGLWIPALLYEPAELTGLVPVILNVNGHDGNGKSVFDLYGKGDHLRSHVNHDPGTHNFYLENRQQLYRMLGDFFFPDHPSFDPVEFPADDQIKTAAELAVDLPDLSAIKSPEITGIKSPLGKGVR